MKPLTAEWIEKADADLATAQRESRVRKLPNYDAVCFHAQQCVEKYLKANLQESDTPFGKTHHLIALLDIVLQLEPSWELMRPQLHVLNMYSVSIRYPGESADRKMAAEALKIATDVRSQIRRRLGMSS